MTDRSPRGYGWHWARLKPTGEWEPVRIMRGPQGRPIVLRAGTQVTFDESEFAEWGGRVER